MNNDSRQTEQRSFGMFDILSYLWTIKWIAVAIIILCTVAGFFYEKYYVSPKYVSESKLIIIETSDTGKISTSEINIGTFLVNDIAEMVVDPTVLEPVIKDLKLDMTPQQLASTITLSHPEDSRTLNIRVATSDPELSQKINNKVRQVTKEKAAVALGADKVNIFGNASLPKSDSSLSRKTLMLSGFVAGIVLSVLLAVILFLIDDKITNSDDVEKYLDLCVLATIPYNTAKSGKRKRKAVKSS